MDPGLHDFPPEPPPPPPRGNGLGVAGFVISLVGLVFTCGLLCPLGLIFSLIGLARRPKGLAIAGTTIGAIGSILLVTVAIPFVTPIVVTAVRIADSHAPIVAYSEEHGEYPDDEEGARILRDMRDGWGHPIRYKRTLGGYELRSAGPDGVFDTRDDLDFEG